MFLLDWMILYLTFVIVYVKLYWYKISAFVTHRNTVTKVAARTYEIQFYIGNTLCKLVVERQRGPPKFHRITAGDEDDVYDTIKPYLVCTPVPVTPNLFGYEKLDLWKSNGDMTEVLADSAL